MAPLAVPSLVKVAHGVVPGLVVRAVVVVITVVVVSHAVPAKMKIIFNEELCNLWLYGHNEWLFAWACPKLSSIGLSTIIFICGIQ